MADQPGAGARNAPRPEYWEYIASIPAPRVVVIKDLDQPPAIGSFWGEVNGNIHKALGCIGTVTNGGVRDLDEVLAEEGIQFTVVGPTQVEQIPEGGLPGRVQTGGGRSIEYSNVTINGKVQ